ncbi:MAG: hypothetical protein M3083_18210 [Actinomycetota bacterium]|nr:hypothetical protein [Actinomycetota bacterium]MDQ6949225.1 hypothetical protein [Actinomycetota bacterium]
MIRNVACGIAVLTVTASACNGSGSHGATPAAATTTTASPLVTPDQARAAVLAVSAVNHEVNSTLDIAKQDTIEAGVAQFQGDAVFRGWRAEGFTSFPPGYPNFTDVVTSVFVPRQTTYPAIFLAYIVQQPDRPGPAYAAYALLSRDSPASNWRLEAIAGAGPPGTLAAPILVDPDGYTERRSADQVAPAAANLHDRSQGFAASVIQGQPPPPGVLLTAGVAQNTASAASSIRGQIVTSAWKVAPEFVLNIAFPTTDNRFLVFDILRGTDTFAYPTPQTIVPSSNDPFIRRGQYHKLVHDDIAIIIGLTGAGMPLTIVGYNFQTVDGHGE